jgi:aryl-phospho-beta-D-glucosidase BglC (GH1 family)
MPLLSALLASLAQTTGAASEADAVRPYIEAREEAYARYETATNKAKAEGCIDVAMTARRIARANAVYPLVYSEKDRATGKLAADWDDVPSTGELLPLGNPAIANPAWGATFKAAISADTLYLLLTARDPALNFGNPTKHYSDCFELFFDPFFRRDRTDDSTAQLFVTATDTTGTTFALSGKYPARVVPVPSAGGWAVEVAIPLDNDLFKLTPFNGLAFGFNVSYNSNDEGKGRTRKLTWSGIDRNDASYHDASVYGAMQVVRADATAARPVAPGPAIEQNRLRRASGETLADLSLIRAGKPAPERVRGFMSGGYLLDGKSFNDMAHDWNASVVRLQLHGVGPKPTWSEANFPIFLDRLEQTVKLARDAGLKVIPVAFEVPCEGVNLENMWERSGDVEAGFVRYWTAIARRLLPYRDAIWGYDLFNEPLDRGQLPYAPAGWRAMAVNILKAIRTIDPDTWIIYETGPGGGWRGFEDLTPLPDPKIIYSLHFYEPGPFTHQGISASRLQDPGLLAKAQETTGVEYPGFIGGRYRDRSAMETSLQPVIDFQQKYGAPIFVGEFSVTAWSPVPSAIQWLKDITAIMEKHKWSWTYHAFREWPGWSLEHEDGVLRKDSQLKRVGMSKRGEVIRDALKANPPPQPRPQSPEAQNATLTIDFAREEAARWKTTKGVTLNLGAGGAVLDGADWDSKINRAIELKAGQRYRVEGLGRGKTMVRLSAAGSTNPFGQLNLSSDNGFRTGIIDFTTPPAATPATTTTTTPARGGGREGNGNYNLNIQVNAPRGRAEVRFLRFVPIEPPVPVALDLEKIRARRPNPETIRGFMVPSGMSAKDAADLRAWGADCIRLQIFPLNFAKKLGKDWQAALPELLDYLEDRIEIARANQLKVILDLHQPPVPGVRIDYSELWQHPDLEKNFITFWQTAATRFKSHGDTIWGYDLYNEPLDRNQLPHAPREWRPLAEKIIKAIREIDATAWVIYEPGPGGGAGGLRDLQPLPDYNVIYSTHFYEPGEFTHQGIKDITGTDLQKAMEKLNVAYPGKINGVHFDKAKLASYFKLIDDFRERVPAPWYIGEFSVVRWAPAGSGERYLRDVLELFEERNWSWSYHAFREFNGWSL